MPIKQLQRADLDRIWRAVRRDKYGAKALANFKKHGFDLERIPVAVGSWPEVIASIPFLPSRRARSRILSRPDGLRLTIRFLRELARSVECPYSNVEAWDGRYVYTKASDEINPRRFREAADVLEKLFSKTWVITEHNPPQYAIADLRWEIKSRTKKSHDRELTDLLDAVFRAGGFKQGFQMTFEALKKTEIMERETRKAARRKLLRNRPR